MRASTTTTAAAAMFLSLLLPASGWAGSSDGRDHELSLELGSLGTAGEGWEALVDNVQLGTVGGRAGLALSERWTLVGDYQLGRHGGSVEVYDPTGEHTYEELGLELSLLSHQLSVGPKFDVQVAHWLRPYATVQALGALGTLRLDEMPNDDEEGLTRYRSLTAGGVAGLGVDLVAGEPRQRIHPAAHLEMGYGYVLPYRFADADAGPAEVSLGDLSMRGFYLRCGVGIRL